MGFFDWYHTWSQSNAQKYPQMDLAWQQMQTQMPKEAAGVSKLAPMNIIERYMFPENYAGVTWPWGRVAFNPKMLGTINPQDLLVHELTHIRQNQRGGMWANLLKSQPEYQKRSYEKEAFAEEAKRKKFRESDIPLPPNGPRKVQKTARTARR
jgi:hypothetical protein